MIEGPQVLAAVLLAVVADAREECEQMRQMIDRALRGVDPPKWASENLSAEDTPDETSNDG